MSKTAREVIAEFISWIIVRDSPQRDAALDGTAADKIVADLDGAGFVIALKARGWDDLEREQTISALRELCAVFGDNDWPEDLNLADVVEKHLGKHLHVLPQETQAMSEVARDIAIATLARDLSTAAGHRGTFDPATIIEFEDRAALVLHSAETAWKGAGFVIVLKSIAADLQKALDGVSTNGDHLEFRIAVAKAITRLTPQEPKP